MATTSNGKVGHFQLPELPSGEPQAQPRALAREGTMTSAADTSPARNSGSSGGLLGRAQVLVATALSRESLLDARHPSLRIAWTNHREAADRWNAPLARHLRHGWGVIHLVIMAVLAVAGWVTETFPRTVITALLIFALIRWS